MSLGIMLPQLLSLLLPLPLPPPLVLVPVLAPPLKRLRGKLRLLPVLAHRRALQRLPQPQSRQLQTLQLTRMEMVLSKVKPLVSLSSLARIPS